MYLSLSQTYAFYHQTGTIISNADNMTTLIEELKNDDFRELFDEFKNAFEYTDDNSTFWLMHIENITALVMAITTQRDFIWTIVYSTF